MGEWGNDVFWRIVRGDVSKILRDEKSFVKIG